ncbi:MAG: hypothetical protein GXO44_01465 [Deferribacteres bacterium]|nr:hypothetical protein [Deferribacteres bacterium]
MNILFAVKTALKVFVILFVGLSGARYLERKGLSRILEKKFAGILKRAGIPEALIMPFVTAFFAGFAGEALVAISFEKGKITEKEIIPAMMLIDFPIYTSFVPLLTGITVPLAGKVGLMYIGLQLVVSFIMSLTGAFIFWIKKGKTAKQQVFTVEKLKSKKESIVKESLFISLRITGIVFVALVAISFLYKWGVINTITNLINHVKIPFFEPEMAPIAAAHAFHIAAAAAVAGKLVKEGLSPTTAVLGMMWGNLIGTPIRGARLVIPRYSAMFGFRRGVKIWLINQGYRAFLVFLTIVAVSLIKGF